MEPRSTETTPRHRGARWLARGPLLFVALLWPLAAPTQEKADLPYWRTNLFKRVLSDQKYLVTRWWPSEFRHPGFTLSLAGATALALTSQKDNGYAYDLKLGDALDDATGATYDRIEADLTRLGNGPAVAVLLGTTYLVARSSGHEHMARTTSLAAESMLDAGIWIEVLKRSFARVRPNNSGAGRFLQYGDPESNSFPSGHAMGAFAVATVFAEEYRDKRWVPWVAYGTAGLISTSRVALGRHFPSDIVVGGILGNSIGRGVVARQRAGELTARWSDRITPLIDPAHARIGVAYSYDW